MEWNEIIITLISAVATTFGAVITAWLTMLINTKVQNGKAQQYLNAALSVVRNVVKATYQTFVEGLKGGEAWTKETQKEALHKALESAKNQISLEIQDFIEKNFGDLDEWLITQIEAMIYSLKNKNKEIEDETD